MQYLQKKFSTSLGGQKYAEGFDKIDWGRKEEKAKEEKIDPLLRKEQKDALEKILTGEESV